MVTFVASGKENEMVAELENGLGKTSNDGISVSVDTLNGAVVKNCFADHSEIILGSTLQTLFTCHTYLVLASSPSSVFVCPVGPSNVQLPEVATL